MQSRGLRRGTVIGGQFRILHALGSGGMGTVYLAEQLDMGRNVVIKMLHDYRAATPSSAQRFKREVRLLARVNHPNIVSVYSFGETDHGQQYIAMEHVPGVTLADYFDERREPLTEAQTLHVAEQILSALIAAHTAGLVHRDLKPSNVMLTTLTEGREVVKVLDFGAAKSLESDSPGWDFKTTDDVIIGTPRYMAPEQIAGDEVDARTDLYALGCILYEMLTGTHPILYETPQQLLLGHLQQPVEPIGRRAPNVHVDETVETFVLTALHKGADERFQSAAEMQAALREVVRGLPERDQASKELGIAEMMARRSKSSLRHAEPVPTFDEAELRTTLTEQRRPGVARERPTAMGQAEPAAAGASAAAIREQGSSRRRIAVVGAVLLAAGSALGTYLAVGGRADRAGEAEPARSDGAVETAHALSEPDAMVYADGSTTPLALGELFEGRLDDRDRLAPDRPPTERLSLSIAEEALYYVAVETEAFDAHWEIRQGARVRARCSEMDAPGPCRAPANLEAGEYVLEVSSVTGEGGGLFSVRVDTACVALANRLLECQQTACWAEILSPPLCSYRAIARVQDSVGCPVMTPNWAVRTLWSQTSCHELLAGAVDRVEHLTTWERVTAQLSAEDPLGVLRTPSDWYVLYVPSELVFRVAVESEAFKAVVLLLDAGGNVLNEDEHGAWTLDSGLEHRVASGWYLVEVTTEDPASVGEYQMMAYPTERGGR